MTQCDIGEASLTPYQEAGYNELTLFRVIDNQHSCWGQVVWLSRDDGDDCPLFSSHLQDIQHHHFNWRIEELPKDEDGFYLWDGDECPVPEGWVLHVKTVADPDGVSDISGDLIQPAEDWDWQARINHIIAFKPTSRPDMPAITGCTFSEQEDIGVHFSPMFSKNEQGEIVNGADMPSVAQPATDDAASALDVQEGKEVFLPKDLWDHRRKEQLKEVIDKSLRKGETIDIAWVEEFNELVKEK